MPPGRNDPCHCGSGKKYKKCCESKDQAREHTTLEKKWTEAEKEAARLKEAETDAEKSKGTDKPASLQKKPQSPKASTSKHQIFTTPKYNMPRKSGGG